MNMRSKEVGSTEASSLETCSDLYLAFCAVLKSASSRSEMYFWYLDGSEKDPESLQHFLGLSNHRYDCVMRSICLRTESSSGTTPAMIEQLAKDIGGSPFADAVGYSYPFVDVDKEGNEKKKKKNRMYLRLGCLSGDIQRVPHQYLSKDGRASLKVLPSANNSARFTQAELAVLDKCIKHKKRIPLHHGNDNDCDKKGDEKSNNISKNINATSKEQQLEMSFFNNVSELFGHNRKLAPNERLVRSLRRLLKQYVSPLLDSLVNDNLQSNTETALQKAPDDATTTDENLHSGSP